MPHLSPFYENNGDFAFSTVCDTHATFPDNPFRRAIIYRWFRKLNDKFSDAPSKPLKRQMWLEAVDNLVEVVSPKL